MTSPTGDFFSGDDKYSVLVKITPFEIKVTISYRLEKRRVVVFSDFIGRDRKAAASEYLDEFCAKWN